MKYWEIIANKIIKVGFSVGWISALDDDGPQFGLLTPGRRKILKLGKRSALRKARSVPSFAFQIWLKIKWRSSSSFFRRDNGIIEGPKYFPGSVLR
jgi:hypothetical protein